MSIELLVGDVEDQDLQDTEFASHLRELDMDRVLAFARERHLFSRRPGGGPVWPHLIDVGRLSHQLGYAFAEDFGEPARRYFAKVCEATGYLHEVIEVGTTFDLLVDRADWAVANLVASLSPDIRLPPGKRLVLLANSIGRAEVPAHIVKAADMLFDLRHMHCLLAQEKLLWCESAKRLVKLSRQILDALVHLRGSPILKRVDGRIRTEIRALELATQGCPKES